MARLLILTALMAVAATAALPAAPAMAAASWSPGFAPGPAPFDAAKVEVRGTLVDCASPGNCAAVVNYAHEVKIQGQLQDVNVVQALTQSRGVWGEPVQLEGTDRAGVSQARASDLSCYAPGECVAVGDYVWTQHNGRWSAGVRPPEAPEFFTDVACWSGGDCVAFGGGESIGIKLFTRRAGSWSATTLKPPTDAYPNTGASVAAVDCPSPGKCTFVGSYLAAKQGSTRAFPRPFVLNMANGTWGPATAAPVPSDSGIDDAQYPTVQMLDISCASDWECSSTGQYTTDGPPRDLALTQSQGQLAAQTLPGDVADIACGAPLRCVAAGNVPADGDEQLPGPPSLLAGPAGGWRHITPVLPGDASTKPYVLLDLACPAVGDCAVTGSYADKSGNRQPLLLEQSGGQWQQGLRPALPGDAAPTRNSGSTTGPEVQAVSCASAGNCTAGGIYNPGGAVFFTTGEGATAEQPAPSAVVREAVKESLAVTGRKAKRAAILDNGGYKAAVTAAAPGKQTIVWLAKRKSSAAGAAATKRLKVAAGAKRFKRAGSGKLRVRLTKKGRKLLKKSKRVKLVAVGTFKPTTGEKVKAKRKIKLK